MERRNSREACLLSDSRDKTCTDDRDEEEEFGGSLSVVWSHGQNLHGWGGRRRLEIQKCPLWSHKLAQEFNGKLFVVYSRNSQVVSLLFVLPLISEAGFQCSPEELPQDGRCVSWTCEPSVFPSFSWVKKTAWGRKEREKEREIRDNMATQSRTLTIILALNLVGPCCLVGELNLDLDLWLRQVADRATASQWEQRQQMLYTHALSLIFFSKIIGHRKGLCRREMRRYHYLKCWRAVFLLYLETKQGIALELLCSIEVVSLHFAWIPFCILTAGFKAHRVPNSS